MSLAVVESYHRHLIQNCSRAQTGSKPHKQRFLCDMSPAPVITVFLLPIQNEWTQNPNRTLDSDSMLWRLGGFGAVVFGNTAELGARGFP